MKFSQKILRIGDFEKWPFFESAILNFIFQKKKCFFFILMTTSQTLLVSKDGLKFWWLPWFPPQNNTCATQCTNSWQIPLTWTKNIKIKCNKRHWIYWWIFSYNRKFLNKVILFEKEGIHSFSRILVSWRMSPAFIRL